MEWIVAMLALLATLLAALGTFMSGLADLLALFKKSDMSNEIRHVRTKEILPIYQV
jgi:hypothetical protein